MANHSCKRLSLRRRLHKELNNDTQDCIHKTMLLSVSTIVSLLQFSLNVDLNDDSFLYFITTRISY